MNFIPNPPFESNPNILWVYAKLCEIADDNGCVSIGVNEWCDKIGLSRQQVRYALNYLIETNKMTKTATNKSTIINICETPTLRVKKSKLKPIKEPTIQPIITLNTSTDTLRKSTVFVKPTIQEIQQHIYLKGYNVDAETFYAHYESNGWMIGKAKMKSWKAALVTWNKNQYGTRQTNNPVARQESRYSGIKRTAEAMLQQPFNLDSLLND